MTISIRNSRGFTLVEVLVAVVVMMVGMLGLLEAINVATEANLKNHLREEGVYLGEKYLNELRGRGFDSISTSYPSLQVASRVRGAGKPMTVERSSEQLAADTKQLQVIVSWTYKGVTYTNRVAAPVAKIPE